MLSLLRSLHCLKGLLQNLAELGTLNEQLERAARKKGVDPTLEPRLKELNEKLAKRADTEAALNAEVARLKEEALVAERRSVPRQQLVGELIQCPLSSLCGLCARGWGCDCIDTQTLSPAGCLPRRCRQAGAEAGSRASPIWPR